LELPVFQREPEGFDQVQPRAGVRTEADGIAGIRGNFRLVQQDIEVQGVGHGAHSTRRCMASRAGGAVELRPWPACVSRGWNVLPAYQREASWLASTPACTATCCMSSADGRTVTTGMSTTRTACWATKWAMSSAAGVTVTVARSTILVSL